MEIYVGTLCERKLKVYAKLNVSLPCFSKYICTHYIEDIYYSFECAMKQIITNSVIKTDKPPGVIIDLDETFMQNDEFLLYTMDIWLYNPALYEYYLENAINYQYGPILPFMYILYKYCIDKNIRVIFISGRLNHHKQQTINNLNFYGVTDFEIYLSSTSDSKSNKIKAIKKLEKQYNILAVLNDQPDSPHHTMVKFPQLYVL